MQAPESRSFRIVRDAPPPAVHRMLRRPRQLAMAVVLLGVVASLFGSCTPWLLPTARSAAVAWRTCSVGGSLLVLVGVVVWIAAYSRCKRRLAARAVLHHMELCCACGYELTGLPDTHRCPECGAEYSKAEVVRKWREWFDRLDPSEYRTI